ncbi:putative ABC transporter permease [Clostridium sp. MSJ-4]|uniref:ABC transporter permease n=1 Tax=Clostridium simiarum TaxID=2841506 RepID=A0ABS6EY70_9CLOT|nr:putative ABC transporter permease [Clostridium simiarum]MBU5590348.1 putative ABC transporter permease [Clostridium simiarum]
MIKKFVIYGLLGFCGEVLWTGIGSLVKGDVKLTGWTYIWMFFIYGLAVFLEPIHDRTRHLSFFIRGGIYMVLIFMTEFITGSILLKVLGVCPWNYAGKPLSPYGLITFTYAPVWFVAGLIFEKIHDTLTQLQLANMDNI